METILITDSCCDLPYDFTSKNNIQVVSLMVNIQGEEKPDELSKTQEYKSFYEAIRNGEMPTTAQANIFDFKEVFSKYKDQPIIYIGFSSALSGCVNSSQIAAKEMKENYPEADITIVDSKCASMGLGLLVYYANELKKAGKTKEEIVSWLEENKLNLNHWFTVSDLNHLARGGRISKTAATFGSLLQLKPIMHVDGEGRLIPVEKAKGRKKSIKQLIDKVKQNIIEPKNQVVFLSHGDCLEEAEAIKATLINECGVQDVKINYVGAAVGSHSGPDTIAIFFMGKKRES